MSKVAKTVEFYDVKTRSKIKVPRESCRVETFETKRGARTRLVGVVQNDDGSERQLSVFVKKDFKL